MGYRRLRGSGEGSAAVSRHGVRQESRHASGNTQLSADEKGASSNVVERSGLLHHRTWTRIVVSFGLFLMRACIDLPLSLRALGMQMPEAMNASIPRTVDTSNIACEATRERVVSFVYFASNCLPCSVFFLLAFPYLGTRARRTGGGGLRRSDQHRGKGWSNNDVSKYENPTYAQRIVWANSVHLPCNCWR